MKTSTYKILIAAICGIHCLAAIIGAIFFAMDKKPDFCIGLSIVALFLFNACRINLHDAKIERGKEDWRRGQDPSEPYLYSNLITKDAVAKGNQAGI